MSDQLIITVMVYSIIVDLVRKIIFGVLVSGFSTVLMQIRMLTEGFTYCIYLDG